MSDTDLTQDIVESQVIAPAPVVDSAQLETPPVAPVPVSVVSPAFLDRAKERGYRFENEDEALDAIDRLATNLQQIAPYADFGKNAVPHWNEFEEWRKQKEVQARTAAEPAKPSSAWAPPQLNQLELETYFKKDPSTGRYSPNPGIPPEIARKAAEWDAYTGRHIYNFRTNPIETLKGLDFAPKSEILGEVKAWYKQEQDKLHFEAQKQATFDELRPLIIDQKTGRLNPYGMRLTEVVTTLESKGITNPREVAQLARQLVDAEVLLSKQTTTAADATIRQSVGMPVTPGGPAAQNIPSRVPPAVRPEAPAPTGMSLHAMLKQQDPNFDYGAMRKELLGF